MPGGAGRTPERGFDATNRLWVTFDRGIQRWAGSSPDHNRSFDGFCASVHVTAPSQQPAHDPVATVDFVGLYLCFRHRTGRPIPSDRGATTASALKDKARILPA